MNVKVMNPGESAKRLYQTCHSLGRHLLGADNLDKEYKEYVDNIITPDNYHSFFPTDSIMKLFDLTDNKLFARPLPFDKMFMPLLVESEHTKLQGIVALHLYGRATPEAKEFMEHNVVLARQFEYIDKKGAERLFLTTQTFLKSGHNNVTQKNMPKEVSKEMKEVIKYTNTIFFNMVDFLNNPEVEITVRNHNNDKRSKKKKFNIPPRIKILVNGRMKHYLDIMETKTINTSSHSYWVRGHFAHLTSDYYTNKQGQAVWRVPHIRGDGELIKKIYELKKVKK